MIDRRTQDALARRAGEDRRKASSEAAQLAGIERRSHQRRIEKERRINNARALLVCMRVYDAHQRGLAARNARGANQ